MPKAQRWARQHRCSSLEQRFWPGKRPAKVHYSQHWTNLPRGISLVVLVRPGLCCLQDVRIAAVADGDIVESERVMISLADPSFALPARGAGH